MEEEKQSTPSEAPAESKEQAPAEPKVSLEDLSKQFVDEQTESFTAQPRRQPDQPVQERQKQDVYAPDPITEPEAYKAYIRQQYGYQQQLEGSLREIASRFDAFEKRLEQQRVDADVNRAVGVVNKKLNVDPDLAEVALEKEYRSNPTFKRIWDNRDRNPEAFEKALGVVADKWYSKFQVRQDPQIAENVRAAQASQRATATTKTQDPNEGVPHDRDGFERFWAQLKNGGL